MIICSRIINICDKALFNIKQKKMIIYNISNKFYIFNHVNQQENTRVSVVGWTTWFQCKPF